MFAQIGHDAILYFAGMQSIHDKIKYESFLLYKSINKYYVIKKMDNN